MASTVLLLDPDEATRRQIRLTLQAAHLEVQINEARNATEAMVEVARADVVLAELGRADLDTVALLRTLRANHDATALPVILLSGSEHAEAREQGLQAGANDYLVRPFSPSELVSRLQVQLRVRSLQKELSRMTAQQERLGSHDDLTGLSNRRHLLDQARRELLRSRRHGFSLSLCAFDVDHFKQVNSQAGFLAGDAVIVEVAQLIERGLRGADVLARVTGARFVALLPQTDASQASLVCERLRDSVRSQAFGGLARGMLALSVGVATFPHSHLESLDEMVDAAEASLDRAKERGGNRVEPYESVSVAP